MTGNKVSFNRIKQETIFLCRNFLAHLLLGNTQKFWLPKRLMSNEYFAISNLPAIAVTVASEFKTKLLNHLKIHDKLSSIMFWPHPIVQRTDQSWPVGNENSKSDCGSFYNFLFMHVFRWSLCSFGLNVLKSQLPQLYTILIFSWTARSCFVFVPTL